jgi:opine dehydrogenase
MGTNTMTVLEWLEDAYGIETGDASGIYEAVQRQEVYRGIAAPKDPSTRYISEDVPMGLVPLSELARLAGVPTPVMDSVITLAGAVHRRDYHKEGRNLRRLGLENMSVKEIRAFVTETA